jgi:hypothetical protein
MKDVKRSKRSPVAQSSTNNYFTTPVQNACCHPVDLDMPLEYALRNLDKMTIELRSAAQGVDMVVDNLAHKKDLEGQHVGDEACWGKLRGRVREAMITSFRPTPLLVLKDLPCQSTHNKAAFAASAAADTAQYMMRKVHTMCNSSEIELDAATEVLALAEYVWQWAVIAGNYVGFAETLVEMAERAWTVARVVWEWVQRGTEAEVSMSSAAKEEGTPPANGGEELTAVFECEELATACAPHPASPPPANAGEEVFGLQSDLMSP